MSIDSRRGTSAFLSFTIHVAAVLLLLLIGTTQRREPPRLPRHFQFVPLASPIAHAGRGGGGQRSPTPPHRAPLPPIAKIQIVPPIIRPVPQPPKLAVPPTLVADAEVRVPPRQIIFGDPNGVPGPPSGGPGDGGGVGGTHGTGVGNTRGPGYGDDGVDGVATVRNARTIPPVLVWKIDPDYSEQARKARFQGEVLVKIDIGPDGRPMNPRVVRPLGLGLDEKAVEAVSHWKFRPGMRNGRPVVTTALIEVHFRLL